MLKEIGIRMEIVIEIRILMVKVVLVVTTEEVIRGRTLEDETGMAIIEDLLVAQTLVLIMAATEEDLQAIKGILLREMLFVKFV